MKVSPCVTHGIYGCRMTGCQQPWPDGCQAPWAEPDPPIGRSSDSKTGGGRKDDLGKAPVFQGVTSYFPRALEAVARVSEYGSKKYAWGVKWWHLEDAYKRYSDALLRHLGREAIEPRDQESSLRHAEHVAWCALARLEVLLVEVETKQIDEQLQDLRDKITKAGAD
jgi:Domain of unknown function (DUF5664)